MIQKVIEGKKEKTNEQTNKKKHQYCLAYVWHFGMYKPNLSK